MSALIRCMSCGNVCFWGKDSSVAHLPCPVCLAVNWVNVPESVGDTKTRLATLEAKVEKLLKAQDDRVGKFPEEAALIPADLWECAFCDEITAFLPGLKVPQHCPRCGIGTVWTYRGTGHRTPPPRGAELPPNRHARSGYAPAWPSSIGEIFEIWKRGAGEFNPDWIFFEESAAISDEAWVGLKTAMPEGVTWSEAPNNYGWSGGKPKKDRVAKPLTDAERAKVYRKLTKGQRK